ncbi:queuosine precursor transporter [Altericroceibacterium endophyticum]|uniref:Probable queuosine precursor transporter n=1 Tax=Altericroceibacterium endophyticum TaxID=1808508 RepID=A0A6I4T8H2_9SPHN|nr:queuosine precursor transporter [Altericroceibacterium endophyticum]MXO66799.1 queuosine precursor transporter [Altericroceibacterium endophyticum]
MTDHQTPPIIPLPLFMLSLLYGGMACIAAVLGNKLVAFGPFAVEGGIFAFIMLVVISSAIAELYGKSTADRLVLFGFIPILVAMALIQIVIALPGASFWSEESRMAYELILDQSTRLMFAGIVAYGTSQLLNVFLFTRLRASVGPMVWLRGAIAGMLSQAVDTLIFITIAFYGIEPLGDLIPGQLIAKVLLSLILVPPLITICVRVSRRFDRV